LNRKKWEGNLLILERGAWKTSPTPPTRRGRGVRCSVKDIQNVIERCINKKKMKNKKYGNLKNFI